jgi:hypothetical protein
VSSFLSISLFSLSSFSLTKKIWRQVLSCTKYQVIIFKYL